MEPSPRKPASPADHFFALDIRVGRVLSVQGLPKARIPAYKIVVDFGPAGVLGTSARVRNYSAAELTGRLVVGVVNLGTKRIAGFLSEFLLLGSYAADGTVHLLSPEPAANPGDMVG